jgi:hypothetical protein
MDHPDRAPATSPAGAQGVSVACALGLCAGSNPSYGLSECDYDDDCTCTCHQGADRA